ncbi:MAG TPA: hypothetical protein P5348_07060 [Bacteroidales bacterium]|nr:hypothetical protein [Bacteroidales bacterium]
MTHKMLSIVNCITFIVVRYEIEIFVSLNLNAILRFFMYSPPAFARLRLPPLYGVERGIEGVSSC